MSRLAASVRIRVDGVARPAGWVLEAGGVIAFAAAPPPGTSIAVACDFDVPVRFAQDRLEVATGRWQAGDVASVPLIEVREA